MFSVKTGLIVSLLCVTLSVSAAVVPVEDVVQDRAAPVPVDAVAEVREEEAEPSIPVDDAAGALRALENRLNVNTAERSASNCPQGWQSYQDRCYLMVNIEYDRISAEFLCESLGSSLASAHSIWEYSFLQEMTRSAGFNAAWIGGYRFQGFWRWDDGTPFDYNNWYPQSSSSHDCFYLSTEGNRGWTSQACNKAYPSICSMKLC